MAKGHLRLEEQSFDIEVDRQLPVARIVNGAAVAEKNTFIFLTGIVKRIGRDYDAITKRLTDNHQRIRKRVIATQGRRTDLSEERFTFVADKITG